MAATVLVINSQHSEAGKFILDEFTRAAEAYLARGLFTGTKLILRFLGGIQGMLEGDGVYPVLHSLVDKAVALLDEDEVVCLLFLTRFPG